MEKERERQKEREIERVFVHVCERERETERERVREKEKEESLETIDSEKARMQKETGNEETECAREERGKCGRKDDD